MSRLNIFSTIAFCFATLMAPPATNSRLSELTDLGYTQRYEVCLDVLNPVEGVLYNSQYNSYTPDIPTTFRSAVARPDKSVPEVKDKVYPIGSPVLWVNSLSKYVDGKDSSIRAGFTPVGECAIASGDVFVELLSDVVYVPYTNKLILRAYSQSPCALADDLFSRLRQSSATLLTWQLFGSDQLQLLYSGTPWKCVYGMSKNVKTETEAELMKYEPLSGITADDLTKGSLTAGPARIMSSSDGQIAVSLGGFGDREGPSQYLGDAIYSNLCVGVSKREAGTFLRHKSTTHALMGLYPKLKSVKDYVGITSAPVVPFTLSTEKKTAASANRQAYERVYATMQSYLSDVPFGTEANINDILSKLS